MSVLRQKIKECVQYYPELQYKRMKLGEWPPSNSSPLHPIEPWGKQFFVFNTLIEGKKLYMENIKNELNRLENISREEDNRYEKMLLHNVTTSYCMQRMKTGRHSSHTIMRSTHRNKK